MSERVYIGWACGYFLVLAIGSIARYDETKDNPLLVLAKFLVLFWLGVWGLMILI